MKFENPWHVDILLRTALLLGFLLVISVEYGTAESFSATLIIIIAWNTSPLIIAWTFLHITIRTGTIHERQNRTRSIATGFAAAACAATVLAHLAWHFDWHDTATGSSTAGLMFLTLPIVSLVAGCIGGVIGLVCRNIFLIYNIVRAGINPALTMFLRKPKY